jgi:5-formyltetrahydrofolate cyclo-ligase
MSIILNLLMELKFLPKIEVVFVPLLAYDKQGQRVGYGKGFYDKFLAECSPATVKIGLSEAEE